MIHLTRIAGLVAAAAVVAVSGLTAAAPQALAASCSGTGCNGKNPQTTGCVGDAVTVSNAHASDGHYIELRYSKACKALWVRGDHFSTVKLEAGHYDSCGSWVVQKTAKTPSTGYWFSNETPNYQWTPMIASGSYDRFRFFGDGGAWFWKNTKKASTTRLGQTVPARC